MIPAHAAEMIIGELAALKACCCALVAAHPDPDLLHSEFVSLLEQLTATLLATSGVSETVLASFRDIGSALAEQMAAHAGVKTVRALDSFALDPE